MEESEWRRFAVLDRGLRISLAADLTLLAAGLFLFSRALGGTWTLVGVLILLGLFPTLLAQALAAGAWARRESRSLSLLHRDNRASLGIAVGAVSVVGGLFCLTIGTRPGFLGGALPYFGLPLLLLGLGLWMWGGPT